MHPVIIERRNGAVFLGAQALEPGLAGMDIERIDARADHGIGETVKALLGILIVDADAALDRHRPIGGVAHGTHAIGNEIGLCHEAGAELARLHPIGRAADIEVDLGIVVGLGQRNGPGQFSRIGAAQLQGNGRFPGVEAQMAVGVAIHDRGTGDHFGEKQGFARQQPMEVSAMPIRPVDHRRDAEFPVSFNHLMQK